MVWRSVISRIPWSQWCICFCFCFLKPFLSACVRVYTVWLSLYAYVSSHDLSKQINLQFFLLEKG
ncbi:hypothetical protein BY458DRAFT_521768 [Sporodiniella umbellata]|nr:hypothetical protein BY458DRAFT_521768 [Sporodiniella umbellata]